MSPPQPTPVTPTGHGRNYRPRPATHLSAVPAASVRTDDELDTRADPAPPRGFLLYVGLSEAATRRTGVSLERIASALRTQMAALLPDAETSLRLVTDERPGRSSERGAPRRRGAHTGAAGDARAVRLPERGVVIDYERWQVHVDGRPVALAPRELDLLITLVGDAGVTLSRRALVDKVWSPGGTGTPPDARAVDVIVGRLRSKLGGYGAVIRTVRGVGYRFDPHPDVVVRKADPEGIVAAATPLADLLAARRLLETVEKYVNDAC